MIQAPADPAPLYVIGGYLAVLVGFGVLGSRLFRSSSSDFFVASRSIGPFLLLMSVFGTTMTAFTLIGSTGEAYERGIGVYGLVASASGIVHSLVFFLVGIRLWAIGKRHDFRTQIQFFRGRFESSLLGYLLFPILVGLVIPYVLVGIVGAGAVVQGVTVGMFPEIFTGVVDQETGQAAWVGAVPPWLTGLTVCAVVLAYIIGGGVRAAAIANACQTIVFMTIGVLAFVLISGSIGGLDAASQRVLENPASAPLAAREGMIGKLEFMTYMLVPLSVGMFPHVFQHWLTARSAKTFRVTVVAHPVFIMILWVPCVLIGIWAAGLGIEAPGGNTNAILAEMVGTQLAQPVLSGLLTAGILAAIMSSLDSQFVCLGTIFTHDIVIHAAGRERFSDRQQIALGRTFIVLVVLATYALSLFPPPNVFALAVWCFSGFAGLFPLVLGALYWRGVTRAGAYASVLVAAGTWAVLFYQDVVAPSTDSGGDHLILGMLPVAIIVAMSAVTLIAVSFVTSPPPARVVDKFFPPRSNHDSLEES